MFRGLAFIGVLIYVIVMLVQRIPGGFVPEEDQGYLLVNALLPDAASLERTDAVMKKVEAILGENEAVEASTRSAASRCSPAPTRRTWASSSCS